jgi:hypothetical protein
MNAKYLAAKIELAGSIQSAKREQDNNAGVQ